MTEKVFNVLFLCMGNAARSLIAESQLNTLGGGRFKAYSAGSAPKGEANPLAIKFLETNSYSTEGLRSKSWDEFAAPGAPVMDYVLTVCDDTVDTVNPVWPGQPISAHWQVRDPEAVQGDEATRHQAMVAAAATLRRRIELLVSLPTQSLDRMSIQSAVSDIGKK